MEQKSVLIGMSGGVDSSVAAALLKEQGYHVIGATMRLWTYSDSCNMKHEGCCAESAVEDARRVCDKLGIDFYVMNFKDMFKDKVVDYFVDEYIHGRTPNPCIACNKYLKFDALLKKALAMGIDYVATGHYAKIEKGEDGKYILRASEAVKKDQSYVLYNFTQEQLAHTLMPLGGYNKDWVRQKAEELGLGNTHFMNPSGLDNPEHYTTVYNLALIARYAMTLPQFREIVATQTAQVQALNSDEILYFSNHNKMLSLYEGANGIKTGFTKSTGRCLVSSAQRDGMEFIAVTLNDPNDWNDHAEMLDYAFSEHYPKKLIEQGDTVKVTNIDGKDYSMVAASDFTIPFKEHQKTQVEVISHISNDLQAPINQGEKVGWLEIVCDGVSVGEVDIISENDIYGVSNIRLKNSFFSSFIRVAKILLV